MNDAESKINVFLVDDHALFRGGLKGLLGLGGAFNVVGEAGDGLEFLGKLPESGAEVVLMDIDMPVMNGFEATAKALELVPSLKVITLSMHGDEEYYFRMVEAGAKGFLLKSSEIGEVSAAIEAVAKGGSWFSQELLQGLVGTMKAASNAALHAEASAEEPEDGLSVRELEVLPLICQGMSNQEIADKLFISKRTVDKHRANILFKTGCKNTASLVVFAIKNSLVEI